MPPTATAETTELSGGEHGFRVYTGQTFCRRPPPLPRCDEGKHDEGERRERQRSLWQWE